MNDGEKIRMLVDTLKVTRSVIAASSGLSIDGLRAQMSLIQQDIDRVLRKIGEVQ